MIKDKMKINMFIDKFYHSYWYMAIILILAVVSFKLKIPEICFVPTMIIFGIALLVMDDITPVVFGMFLLPYCFPIGTTPEKYLYLLYYTPIAIIPLIIHIFMYKPNKIFGRYFNSQLFVSVALIIGGLGSNITLNQYTKGLAQALTLGVLILVLYLICINYCKPNNYDFAIFVSKAMTAIGIGLVIEQIIGQFFNPNGNFFEINLHSIRTGTYVSTNIGMIYLLTAPFAIYLALKQPKTSLINYSLSAIQFICCYFTFSRGAILLMCITLPACIIYPIIADKEHRKKTIFDILIILSIVLIIYLCFMDKFNEQIKNFIDRSNRDNINSYSSGRISLYIEGFKVFSMFPFFGAGMGYTSSNLVSSPIEFFHFHSTLVQVLACMGVFGFVAYGYNYIIRAKILFEDIKNPFNMIVLFAFIGFEGYSAIDCGVFIPMPFMFIVTLLVVAIELNQKYAQTK